MSSKRNKITIIILVWFAVIEAIIIFLLLANWPKKKPVAIAPPLKGKIAIVLDDWGYHQNTLAIVSGIKYPLTMSVLPNLAYSSWVSEKLHASGFEVILHLPSEPKEKIRLEKDTLLVSFSDAQIKRLIDEDLTSVLYAKGASNHMGSLLTSDRRAMTTVFNELKKRRLYFLDSVVVSNSVCPGLAKELNIKFARRDIFLDNQEDPAYIRAQIKKLKNKAKLYGHAIGIGHDRIVTLEVLKDAMPELAKEGYRFVFVSELVK